MIEMPLDANIFMRLCMECLLGNNVLACIACPFGELQSISVLGWLLILAFLVGEIIIYKRTGNLMAVGAIGVFSGIIFIFLLGGGAIPIGGLIILASAAILVYKAMNR